MLFFSSSLLAENLSVSCKSYVDDKKTFSKNQGIYFFNIGMCQLPTVTNKKEFDLLAEIFKQSANSGYMPSNYALGMLYENKFYDGSHWLHSHGEMIDLENALKYFKKIAPSSAVAQNKLGEIYLAYANIHSEDRQLGDTQQIENVESVLPDIDKAIFWLNLAAKHGNAAAQGTLADLYFQGIGVPQDFVTAYVWQNISVASQLRFNKRFQKGEIGKQLTESQIENTKKQYDNLTIMQKNEAQAMLKKYSDLYFLAPKKIDEDCSDVQSYIAATFVLKKINEIKKNLNDKN